MKKKISNLIAMGAVIFGLISTVNSHNLETDLSKKPISMTMDKKPLAEIFHCLIEKFDIPIGFEESTLDSQHDDYDFLPYVWRVQKFEGLMQDKKLAPHILSATPPFFAAGHLITVNASNQPLSMVLDSIVGQMKNYEWRIKDDVVNIFPVAGRNRSFQKLLELEIETFRIEKPSLYVGLIRNKVLDLPEISEFCKANKTKTSKLLPEITPHLKRPIAKELIFDHITVLDLLNKITQIKRGGWIVRRHRQLPLEGGESFDIYI